MPRSVTRTWLLPLLAAAALGACNDLVSPRDREVGSFVGSWDGQPWEGRSYAVLRDDTLHLVAHRPDPQFFYDEYIRASVPFRGAAAYQVPAAAGELAKITGGDAGYFPQASGNLLVTTYDAEGGTISGQIELRAPHDGRVWEAQGQFHARIYPSFQDVPPARGR